MARCGSRALPSLPGSGASACAGAAQVSAQRKPPPTPASGGAHGLAQCKPPPPLPQVEPKGWHNERSPPPLPQVESKGWHNAGYIFPAGYRSRLIFRSSTDLSQNCVHECAIRGAGGEYWPLPTFVVTAMDRPDQPCVGKSCTGGLGVGG